MSSAVTIPELPIYNCSSPRAVFPFLMAAPQLSVSCCYLSWWWDLVSWWWSDFIMGLVSVSTTGAIWSCRNWFHTFHFFWVEIRICTNIKITSWCRAWLIACDKDILRPYISRVGFKCLAGVGILASNLHWASSHLASWEEEATAWRGQYRLEGWKNVSGS